MNNIIYSYTWDDAVNDGTFIDVSKNAQELGIKYPTAVTRNLWESYIVPHPDDVGQSEQGRLWDVLWMFRCAAHKTRDSLVEFKVIFLMRNKQKTVILQAVCEGRSPENPEPIITIMLPEDR